MAITTEDIKELRDATGVSIMQCRKALEEAEGDMGKAVIILRKASSSIAAKKADRELNAGAVSAYVHSNGTVGAMVTLSCETDFVSKNPEFVALARDIAMHIVASNPLVVRSEEMPKDVIEKAKEVFAKEAEGKPGGVRDKIIAGKLKEYLSERVLLEQAFIKDTDTTIRGLIESATQKFGEKIEVREFSRFSVR